MAAKTRTPAQVRGEIEAEREQLAGAVEHLRGKLGVVRKLRARLPIVAGGAAMTGFVFKQLVARRGRRRR